MSIMEWVRGNMEVGGTHHCCQRQRGCPEMSQHDPEPRILARVVG